MQTARAETAQSSAHALDLGALRAADVTFWSAWDGRVVVGVGALERLSPVHGEIKSMHTAAASRRKGSERQCWSAFWTLLARWV